MGTGGKVSQADKGRTYTQIVELVQKYHSLTASDKNKYNEENTKKDFIQPLFAALGWDMANAEEVWAEHPAGRGPVDYAFRIDGVARFYLEAKPLKNNLANPDWVKQAISYAYNKGIPWVVLTNFKELWVFTGDQREQRFITLRAEEYIEELERLSLLSKESIAAGSLGEEARKAGVIPPAISVEKRLYGQLRHWREKLISQVHKYHTEQPLPVVDEIVQRLFNRLIFIPTCEDRGFEEKRLLAAVHQYQSRKLRRSLLKELRRIFREFDGIYDSDLFKTHLLDEIHIDDPLLGDIIQGLYQIPGGVVSYDFSVIDADVLGAVYEQYLGHVAEIAKQRQREAQRRMDLGLPEEVQFELTAKREKRKGQGIYYTPKWVVDYIVKQTVGRFVEEHSERPDAIHEMTILDPACGSGSFLIRAYDALLRYHADASDRPEEHIFSDERTAILKRNIFGVDLDSQAVEIARLNLLIRGLAQRELLPFLDQNIRRGNSLISGEPEALKKWFGDEWEEKHPLDWEKVFPKVMSDGGFDVVIGNPPYVRVDALPKEEKRLWKDGFGSAVGKYDVYYLFLELASRLISDKGCIGFITPNRYCTNTTGEQLRRLPLQPDSHLTVISVSRVPVFTDAAVYPVITVFRRADHGDVKRLTVYDIARPEELPTASPSYELLGGKIDVLPRAIIPLGVTEKPLRLTLKILKKSPNAGHILKIQEGLRIPTSWESTTRRSPHEPLIVKQYQFSRYSIIQERTYLPLEYFAKLDSKRSQRVKNCLKPKLVFAEDALQIEATLDQTAGLCQGGVYYATLKPNPTHSLKYLLALYNSKLLTFVFKSLYSGIHMGGGYLRFRTQYLEELPLRPIDFSDKIEKGLHDVIVSKVERMLELQERMGPIRDVATSEREELQQLIDRVDREIDNLVYDLYGLTRAERKLVEGGVGKK